MALSQDPSRDARCEVDRDELRKLLRQVRSGKTGVEDAVERMKTAHVEALEFATLDLHRALRRGFPEVVYGPGKTPEQIVEIVGRIHGAGQTALVTRVGPEVHDAVAAAHPGTEYHEKARAVVLRAGRRQRGRPGVVVMAAGTSDIGVAEEAVLVAELMGNRVVRIYDVGVAGLHRLLAHREVLTTARVIVTVAGMEGALPSVVAGLTDCPVIGVPTSTGYGVGGRGEAALLAMLNSCAGGLTVVNIDNGFGAGYAAALINRR
jgi:NCAIR mutase (PurE)-related protein